MIQGIDLNPALRNGYGGFDELFIFTDLSGQKITTPSLNFFNAHRIKPFSIERDDGGALNGANLSRPGLFFDNSIESDNQGRMVYQLNGYYNAQKVFENNVVGFQLVVKSHIDDATRIIYSQDFSFNLPSIVRQGQQSLDPGSSDSRIIQNKIKFTTIDSSLFPRILAGGGTLTTVNALPHFNNELSRDLEYGKSFETLANPFLGSRALSGLTENHMASNGRISEMVGVNHSFIPSPLDFLSLNSTSDGEITKKLEPMVEALTRQPMIHPPVDEMAGIAGQGSAKSFAEFDLTVEHASVLSRAGRFAAEPRDYMDHNRMVANARSTRNKKIDNQLLKTLMSISPGQRQKYDIAQSSFYSNYYRFNAIIELDIDKVLDNPRGEALSVHIIPMQIVRVNRKPTLVPDTAKKIEFALRPSR